jgi:chromosome segregation ATPase
MDHPDLPDRVTLLERMADQQLRLNAQLIDLTARLGEEQGHHADALFRADVAVTSLEQEQARHAERLERYDAILTRLDEESARHAERLERLDTILQAIKDLLDRGNGH